MASLLSGTTIGGHVAVHANNISTYALTSLPSHTHDDRYIRFTGAELTEGNYYYFRSNRGSYLGGLDSATLQVYATGGNSAFMSFHRSGNYAVNFGLDADNVMRIGGWSAGADRWVLDMSGNNWVAGSFRAPIFYDSQDTAYYVDPNSTSSLNRIVTAGRLEVTYNTDRYQMNFYRASASNWWVTNDSDRLGLHLNNVGDKFYFATDGDFYSTANGWLSTALAGKLSTSGNAASATTASQVSGVAISSGQAQALKNTLDSPTLPYKCDIYVDGEANKFYPVHFMFGDQDIWRRIIIRRGYGEEAPWDPIGTGVHHGGLLIDWEGNFGGWGGAEYSDRLRVYNESYTNVCADMYLYTHAMGYVFMLRGGHALYHIFSDQPIRGYYQEGTPDIAYSSSTLFYDDNWSGNNTYDVYAPRPLELNEVNSSRIDGLRTKKQSLFDSRYQLASSAINTSNIGSQSVNYASSAGSVAWTNVSSRPTALSQFTNDLGNYGGWYSASGGTLSGSLSFADVADNIRFQKGSNHLNLKDPWSNFHLYIPSGGIYSDATAYYFRNTSSTIWLSIESGNVQASSSLRAPIFYDSADTGYYVDPNSASYLSTLRVADAVNGVSLSVGNGSTHGVYTLDNARKYLVVAADYYPHMAIVASGANNTNHGPVFSFVGSEGGNFRQWNLGISNNNPFLFSIGYNRSGDPNPHYGIGDGWSGSDYDHARLSIDRDGNTKIRGMLYVNGTSGGISTGSAVIHAGNIGSQSVNYANSSGITEFQSIPDNRGSAYTPNAYAGNRVWWHFNNKDAVGGYGTYWHAIQTVSPWSSYDPSHRQQQIQWGGTDISFRYATSGTTWSSWFRFITDANIASQSVSYADESGYSASSGSVEWTSVQNKPATFAPSAHTHDDRYYTESESDGRYVPYGSITGSFGLNDNKLYLRTNGDNNHYLWNASDDWEELNAYEGTGFRITSNQGATGVLYVYGSSNGGYTYSPYSFRAPIFYDSADTNYYVDPNSTSMLYRVNSYYLSNPGDVADNHPYGIYFSSSLSTAYAIFREPGAWNHPYPDLRIAFHTGIKIGANAGYEGVRFYTDYDMSSQVMSVNNGSDPLGGGNVYVNNSLQAGSSLRAPIFYDSENTAYYLDPNSTSYLYHLILSGNSYFRPNTWIQLDGNYGVYWPNHYGLHIYPNNDGSYGSLQVKGVKNSWHGIHFDSGNTLMSNANEAGFHQQGVGWKFRWYNGEMYISAGSTGGGTERTVIHSGNIGSQSVNYAATAGASGRSSSLDIVGYGSGNMTYYQSSGTFAGYSGWAGYFVSNHGDGATYYNQTIIMPFWGPPQYSRLQGGTFVGPYTFWSTENLNDYAPNMNQYVRTSDNVTFNTTTASTTTAPIILVNNHSDNTKGYRIHNTSGSSVSAMFTNSSNQLVIAAGAVDQINLNKKVYVNGVALGVNVSPSATAGRIDASNDIVAYSSSDERLKQNITPIENALDKVKSLTGVEFDWKPEYKHAHGYEGHDTGIIAQQVQEVIPSAVRTNDTGFLAVRYEKLIGLLIEANKELAVRVEELEKKLG